MGKNIKTPTAPKQPKTVSLGTYMQSLAIAILTTGIIATIGGYVLALNMYSQAHQTVAKDFAAVVSKDNQ